MNYIILSDSVSEALEEKYNMLVGRYGYSKAFDSYLVEQLSFDGIYKIADRCKEDTVFYLIGKGCRLSMELSHKYACCFYAKNIFFFEKDSEFIEKLAQTQELPGEWDVVLFRETHYLDTGSIRDISDFLSSLKISYKEYYEFEGKWRTWDLYNTKLRELEEKAELESERKVQKVLLENNVFTLTVDELSDLYKEDADLCASFDGNDKFQFLGKITAINRQNRQIEITCEKHDLVKSYVEKKVGKITSVRIIDFGTLARLKRQREAMKRLFQNEAANPNIKDIIMGRFPFYDEEQHEITMEQSFGLFGSNVSQKEAYIGAVNAPDLYLIQGPPGTGKTTIITEIVRHAISHSMKVLISSETHIAVDNVLERIQYTENVVPVRLGRIERIDEGCISFMPEKIAESILENARRKNESYDGQGISLQLLVSECRKEWKKKDEKLAGEIRKIRESLCVDCDLEELLAQIVRFEQLVCEMNEMYVQIEAEKESYSAGKGRLLELKKEKAKLEEQLYIEEYGIMDSGVQSVDGMFRTAGRKQMKSRLLSLNDEIETVCGKLSQNRYETLTGAYKRKMRRYERRKQELSRVLATSGSLLAAAHQIKKQILDLMVLEKQRNAIKAAMEAEIDALASDYKHKQELWEMSKDIRSEWTEATRYIETKEEIERIYMKRTNAVFATCTGIAASDNGKFADMEYDYVIIDEAAKCNMMDILIPIVKGKKIILVGDHKQLYPMLEIEELKDENDEEQIQQIKEHILFKWLYEEIVPQKYKIMLNRQYRMEPTISEFVSEHFYDGNLLCEKEREKKTVHASAMTWIDCENSNEELRGTSCINIQEAELILRLTAKLDALYQNGIKIGIICIYKAQANYIQMLLKETELKNISVECSTVDAFQGKEKHTIIFNTVRSSRISEFMRDENRVNVAVSRAQEYLYVVGKAELMKEKGAGILGKLYQYIKKNGDIRIDNG